MMRESKEYVMNRKCWWETTWVVRISLSNRTHKKMYRYRYIPKQQNQKDSDWVEVKGGIFQTERVTISRWVMNECAFKETKFCLFAFCFFLLKKKKKIFTRAKKMDDVRLRCVWVFPDGRLLAGMDEGFEVKTTTTRHAGENDMFLFSILTLLSLSIFFFFSPFLFAVKQIRACFFFLDRKKSAICSYTKREWHII